jgi:SprT protein
MIPEGIEGMVERWGRLWGVGDLADSVTVEFSRRLRTSLGRCRPASGLIRLAERLQEVDPGPLEEVLCHELAHVAAFRLHGPRIRPHGPEWKALVSQAGFLPRARFPGEALGVPPTPPRFLYEHRCPVCRARRVARRTVRAWRCAGCLAAGRSGKLIVTKFSPGPPPPMGP